MTGQNSTVYLAAIILALFGYVLWRNNKRRGEVVAGAGIAPAVEAALRRLLAGQTGFVVVSVSPSVYLQFPMESNGPGLADANCPAHKEAAAPTLPAPVPTPCTGSPNHPGI